MRGLRLAAALLCALVLGLLPELGQAAPGDILTVAGNGVPGYTGDSFPAISAELFPSNVAADSAGNLYIADANDNVVRRVDAVTGIIATVAGTGGAGFSGDGGPALQAALNGPGSVALDSAGNLYIADRWNSRIRMVSGGTITTVAGTGDSGNTGDGGPATSAQLAFPWCITLDSSGNLYIADFANNNVRKVDTGGNITTVAGGGSQGYGSEWGPATTAQLSGPAGLALDNAGDLYISDSFNQTVRKVEFLNGSLGPIHTVAGTFVAGSSYGSFGGDGQPATTASLYWPKGLTLDSAGNLYIADSGNNAVRRVAAGTGIISTVAGIGETAGFAGDMAPATAALLHSPQGVALDGLGNLFIADTTNNRVRKVVESMGNSSTVVSSSASNATYGQPVVFTATVSGSWGSPTGTVTFTDGTTTLGTGTSNGGVATISASLTPGNHSIVAVYNGNAYYTASTSSSLAQVVNKAVLTVSADPKVRTTGTANPALSYTVTGFVNGENSSFVNGTPVLTTTATTASAAGSYPITITVGTLTAGNYSFNFVNGALSVIAPYTITTSAGANGAISASQSVNYGAQSAAVTVTPNYGYSIASVLVDQVPKALSSQQSFSITFSNVVANHTVVATFAAAASVELDVTVTGSNGGGGSVYSAPGGISCLSGTCSGSFFSGYPITLTALPGPDSVFSGWSGACSATTGACTITPVSSGAVTAAFTYVLPVRNSGTQPASFAQLQTAYNSVLDGGTMQARDFKFTENLVLDRNVNVFLNGGFDTNYLTSSGVSSLLGSLIIRSGSLTVDKLLIY